MGFDLIEIITSFVKAEKEKGISKDTQQIGLDAICKTILDEVYK
jgi:hypothetical protein